MRAIYFSSLLCLFLMQHFPVWAQHQELSEKPRIWTSDSLPTPEGHSLLQAFRNGKANGHFRSFLMATNNADNLSDYSAWAAGGGLRFETAPLFHLRFAVSGYYLFRLYSNDLTKPDALSGQSNRYEIGLFDIQDASNRRNLERLEELYLSCGHKGQRWTFGKQLLNTPFLNLQDGRMRPSSFEGLFGESHWSKTFSTEFGLLYAVAPRSTTKWYSIGESIGLYPQGVSENGKKSDYASHVRSDYLLHAAIFWKPLKGLQLQSVNLMADRLFWTSLQQMDAQYPINRKLKLFAGLQALQQAALHKSTVTNTTQVFIQPGSRAFSFGGRAGVNYRNSEWSLAYNRITAHGRYLMPREWGRDPFFTFLPRERNEGFGDVHAWVTRLSHNFPKSGLQFSIAGGLYRLPDVKDTRLNKYGMPSYVQTNFDLRYRFRGWLQGLDAQFLFVAKPGLGNTYQEPRYRINKVDMLQYNLVLNYRF